MSTANCRFTATIEVDVFPGWEEGLILNDRMLRPEIEIEGALFFYSIFHCNLTRLTEQLLIKKKLSLKKTKKHKKTIV